MKVALDEKYKGLANKLREMGYEIVPLYAKESVHCVLYHGDNDKISLNSINNSTINGINDQGVLIIDIKNKTAQEVDRIIKKRLYTSLF